MGWGESHSRRRPARPTLGPWTVEHHGERPLTVNRVADLHRQQWARHTKAVRAAWATLTTAAKVPRLDAVVLEITPLHADRRSPQDVAACAPEAKAAIDGIVDAGVIDDDNPNHLHAVIFLPPEIAGVNGLRITIHPASPVPAPTLRRRAA